MGTRWSTLVSLVSPFTMVPALWWGRGGCWWSWTAGLAQQEDNLVYGLWGTWEKSSKTWEERDCTVLTLPHTVKSLSALVAIHWESVIHSIHMSAGRWFIKSPWKKKPAFSSSGRKTNILSALTVSDQLEPEYNGVLGTSGSWSGYTSEQEGISGQCKVLLESREVGLWDRWQHPRGGLQYKDGTGSGWPLLI